MKHLSPSVQVIKTTLDKKYVSGQVGRPFFMVKTVKMLLDALVLEPEEKDQIVEMTAAKLHEILSNGIYDRCSAILGSLELYKDTINNRTKTVTFMANHKQKKIDVIHGHILDSQQDYEAINHMDAHMENVHRNFLVNQYNSERDGTDIVLTGIA